MGANTFIDQSREKWLKAHHDPKILTASQIPAVVGACEYDSAYSMFHKKAGNIPWDEETRPMRRGTHMEPFIASEYALETGVKLFYPGEYRMYYQDTTTHILATPDRFEHDEDGDVVEFKAPGARAIIKWKDGSPLAYEVQVQMQLYCTGKKKGKIAAMLGDDLKIVPYDRNDELRELILQECEKFLKRLVDNDAPDPDDSESTTAALKKLHPDDNDLTVELDEQAMEKAKGFWDAKAAIKLLEKEKKGYENWFKDQLGPGAFGTFGKLRVSYKTVARNGYTVEPGKYRKLNVSLDN